MKRLMENKRVREALEYIRRDDERILRELLEMLSLIHISKSDVREHRCSDGSSYLLLIF